MLMPWLLLAISAILAAVLWLLLRFDPLLAWLLAINLVTFFTYGRDKQLAGAHARRIPERSLLALAALGGTLGAYLGMRFFHHKTRKLSFQQRFWLLVAAQVLVVIAYWLFLRPLLF